MKISEQVRADAALICALAASTPTEEDHPVTYCEIARDLGWSDEGAAVNLAAEAWGCVRDRSRDWTRATDAEAEALLRTGWSP